SKRTTEREVSRSRARATCWTPAASKHTRVSMADKVTKKGLRARKGLNGMESETNASLGGIWPQTSRQLELRLDERGEAPQIRRSEEEQPAASENGRLGTGPR